MKVSRQKSSCFLQFFVCPRNFLYEILRWHYSDMDLSESMWDSAKVFCEDLHVKLTTKIFCLETFMVYGNFSTMTITTLYCVLRGRIKVYNSSITTIMC